ncbi:hypothetical protein [Pontibacter actiniarum]|uniref:Uncharacterized protein n=1 Tax=Pontibacter actiniarum TaxID=323450 RepID=A0A1X9YTN1_9BACT|nr:hypothetical protein [Pontibacter actiniarum]ARS36202.1 hypothetical protein CA264_12580 [Pontibacter actiniarum]
MTLLQTLLPLLLSFMLTDTPELHLQQDLQKDLAKLQQSNRYFISDNSTLNPSLQGLAQDLQLFALVANLDLSQASYQAQQQGPHRVEQWLFSEGEIRSITQVQSNVAVDTVVTQRYLENRPPTQQRIQNNFTFRTYLISTSSGQAKLYYLTEAEQGLLAYRLGERQVEIGYTAAKEGLSDVLPAYRQEVKRLAGKLPQQEGFR